MPKRDSAPIGAPCWVDLMTKDQDQAASFYGEIFGWTVDDPGPDYGGYKNFHRDGIPVAGFMHNDGAAGPVDFWSVYLATDDAQKTVDAATANGGQVFLAPMAVMELGTMAMIADAGGAAVGIWQPGEHKGFGIFAETGAPSWFELHTRDYDASVAFYRNVFEWDTHVMSDTPDFRYVTLGNDDDALAGIMDDTVMPDEGPAHWAIYFGVDDTDATLEKLEKLGGATVTPGHDTPYGRLAVATDPTGAQFRLVANP